LIDGKELEALEAFDSRGQITLSAYLSLDSLKCRDSAYEEFICGVEESLANCNPKPECQRAIREDVDIVGLYLRTNGHRWHAGLAIFSCASELFWRAYPLSWPVSTQVSVGPRFNVEPLMRFVS
jgi:hypothetical protein